jgi:uncharacterized membrane protein YidH (DUF202 family)
MNQEIINFLNLFAAVILFIIILVFIVLSMILNYHWNRYEISVRRTNYIKKIYFTVSIILILIMLILFLSFKTK